MKVKFKLTKKQHEAVCYGRRQLVSLSEAMDGMTHYALWDKDNQPRLDIECEEGTAVALAHCAQEFAYDGHSPGPMSMLGDAEEAMWTIRQALEDAGSEHFEECMSCGGNPDKDGCEVCGVVGY